jgi:hypothetical protein
MYKALELIILAAFLFVSTGIMVFGVHKNSLNGPGPWALTFME